MRIAVIGGAGARTPLLIHGLSRSALAVEEAALYDTDQERLSLIAPLAQMLAGGVRVRSCADPAECLEGADFIFTSIRVGGIEGRARDEAAIVRRGIVGQETVGPGGFAMAMRTIPAMIRYAQEAAVRAPEAWIINFTNPVGIITQAVCREAGGRVIGICDTPTELFHEAACALGLDPGECHFDYFGLNHLGWLRDIYHRGRPQMHRLWGNPGLLREVYRAELFERDFLLGLKLLPTEYLYYYYRPALALENIRRAGVTRGSVIAQLNRRLFEDLGRPAADAVRAYEAYLAARNAGYMEIESGSARRTTQSPWAALTGYDKIALSVVEAIHSNSGAIIPLDVLNRGSISCLEADDIVEVPCAVNANGAHPLNAGPVPESVRPLIIRVKEYERLTIAAALSGDRNLARRALASNPLVPDLSTAEALLAELQIL